MVNLLLLAGVLVLSYHLVGAWEAFEEERNLPSILERAERQAAAAEEPPLVGGPSQAVLPDLAVIGERDLFRPERRPPAVDSAPAAIVEAPKFPKRPQMQGASQAGGEMRALLTIFDTPKSTGDLRQVSLGDQVQGYQVMEITNTTVVLQWNDVREVIDMFDTEPGRVQPQAQARRGASVTIVRIGRKYAAVETSSTEEAPSERTAGAAPAQAPARPAGTSAGARRALPDRGAAQRRAAGMPAQEQPLIQGLVGVPRPATPVDSPVPEGP